MTDFSAEFLCAVVDTVLPGLPAEGNNGALPPSSTLGVAGKLASHLASHRDRTRFTQVLQAIAEQAGGIEAFIEVDETARVATIQAVERAETAAFYALLLVINAEYYETDEVLRAFGWYVDPPQPRGYPLPLFDEGLLAPVKLREKLWREAE